MCTYSGNHSRILRCDICDSVRGTRWDYYLGQNAEASSGSQQAAPARDSPTAREAAKSQGGSAGARGQRSILGFFSEADRKGAAASASQPAAEVRGLALNSADSGGTGLQSRGMDGGSGAPQQGSERGVGESRVEWEQSIDGRWTCSRCGASMADEGRAEHEDFHLALLLQKAESGGLCIHLLLVSA